MVRKLAIILFLACLLVTGGCCLSHEAIAKTGAAGDLPGASPQRTSLTAGTPTDSLDFALINSTGTPLRAIYVSPNDSTVWQENVLGGDGLDDGATVNIRFNSAEGVTLWDLKVEDAYGHYAEWKRINLSDVSRITLRVNLGSGPIAVAEVE